MVTENERAWLVNKSTEIHGASGDTVSLIPLGGAVQIEATTGLAWPLADETLAFGPARGVSNVMTGAVAEVVVAGNGHLLCIHSPKQKT